MATAGIKAAAYCLNFAPELALHYGGTPAQERKSKPDSEFLRALPEHAQTYEEAQAYAPNKTYIGAMSIDELEKAPAPWIDNLGTPERFGTFGEIMPEDEFLGLMDICDVFDLIWLEEGFAASVAEKLAQNPVIGEKQLARLEKGRPESDILDVVEKQHALPLYSEGKLAGCCRRAHDTDENLEAGIMLENLSCKASGVLALLHLIKNAGLSPSDIDFVVECSEEAVGDAMQRGGGNMAKALAEIAECGNASGFDVRGFCAGPVASVITAASMAACGARANVAVVSGGSVPKLYMNARDHVKKNVKALENCIGSFALLITPDDGQTPVIRLDSLGKHTVGAGAAPQAITSALTFEPLQKAGLKMTDVDKYAPELHNAEITLPAGAGNVPEANYKMIAALSVMKGQIERADIPKFVAERGMPGFVPTQGHIPSGVPYIGHALEALKAGTIKRAMIIGKGSLFLGRLTNLADGASFIMEGPGAGTEPAQGVSQSDVTEMLLGRPVRRGGQPAKRLGGAMAMQECKRAILGKALEDLVARARSGKEPCRIGLMASGGEHSDAEFLAAASAAMSADPALTVVGVGPKPSGILPQGMDWIETGCEGPELASGMENALAQGHIHGAVALHYPFPLGVTTVGRVLTPGTGKPLFMASCTGMSAAHRQEAMLRNAILGVAVAKALGITCPSVGVLNLDAAPQVLRALNRMAEKGYPLNLGQSVRGDGGSLLRGNDLLCSAVDVCVADTLTGNVLMKVFSAFTSGGSYETSGWGYGPSVGEGWDKVVSIVSRASGAPVIANALAYTAAAVRGRLPAVVAEEIRLAKAAGMDDELAAFSKVAAAPQDEVQAPPAVPTDEEIHGIDVLDLELAVRCLWKENIYAEAAMGCTGPVVKLAGSSLDKARAVLTASGYL